MNYFKPVSSPANQVDAETSETLDFILQRIKRRQRLSYEAKYAASDIHDARAIAKLAVSRMRQIARRGTDPRKCLLIAIHELERLTTGLSGAKL